MDKEVQDAVNNIDSVIASINLSRQNHQVLVGNIQLIVSKLSELDILKQEVKKQ
jgi:hypothetical protein